MDERVRHAPPLLDVRHAIQRAVQPDVLESSLAMSSMESTPTLDPDGVLVELTAERWEHILSGHPELEPFRSAVLACIASPTIRRAGREPSERWHYLRDAGPSRWLKVVVAYEGDRGYVRTAFARRTFP